VARDRTHGQPWCSWAADPARRNWDIISAAVDRIVEGDYRARRVAPHVKTEVKAVARKQRADAVAEILLELHLTDVLTCVEKPPAVLDASLEHLAAKNTIADSMIANSSAKNTGATRRIRRRPNRGGCGEIGALHF